MFLKSSNKSKLQMLSCCNFSLGSVFSHDNCVFIVWWGLGWENIMLWPKISGSPHTSLSKMTSLVAANMSGKCPMSHQNVPVCTVRPNFSAETSSFIAANSCGNILAENILTFLVLCHQIVRIYPDISLKMSVFFNSKHSWKMSEHLGKHTWFWHHKHVWKFPDMEHTTPLQNVPMSSKISYHKHNWSLDTKTTRLGFWKDHVLSRARF